LIFDPDNAPNNYINLQYFVAGGGGIIVAAEGHSTSPYDLPANKLLQPVSVHLSRPLLYLCS
jgi:hypothetical protein